MFTATYPGSFLPEQNGKGLHVRFRDLPEALTGGSDLNDTLLQAADSWPKPLLDGSRAAKEFRPIPS